MLGQWCILSSVFREKLTQKVIIEKGSKGGKGADILRGEGIPGHPYF